MTKPFKQSIDAADLAGALGIDARSVRRRAAREGWPSSEVPVNGGKKVIFDLPALPARVRTAVLQWKGAKAVEGFNQVLPRHPEKFGSTQMVAGLPASIDLAGSSSPALTLGHEETEQTRATRDARQVVRSAILRLQEQAACSLKRAVVTFLTQAQAGKLEGNVAAAVLCAARDGRGRKSALNAAGFPSERSLYRWLASGNLTPKKPLRDIEAKPWMWAAAELHGRPQKPTLKWVHEQLANNWNADWGEPISYDTLARFFREKYSRLDALKGRHHGSSLRAHRNYQHRTAEGLEPFVEVHADGWNTHFTAPHPVTGEFVTYEVWHFRDVATRYVTPPAIGLSESTEVILKGLENCIRFGGVPAVWQTDSTGSVKNRNIEFDPISSLSTRAGISIVHPMEIGNSQANGICENFNTYLDREARELATYQGANMDSLVLKRVKKLTEKMVKAARKGEFAERDLLKRQAQLQGKGIVFGSFEEACAWLNAKVEKFNSTPHSSLPKAIDPATGRKAHMTPQQALDAARDAGWEPVAMDEASLIDLFRPHMRRTVTRETVSPFNGQRYYHPTLGDFNGEEVMVAIDTMDGSRVWVKDLAGRLLCEATFMEATAYRSLSYYEFALEKRAKAQIQRKERQINQIEERMAPPALETSPTGQVLPFSIASHPALQPLTPSVPSIVAPMDMRSAPSEMPKPERPTAFSDLAMELFGEQIDAEDHAARNAAETARDARLNDLEDFDGSSEESSQRATGKKVAGE
ncbi:MULTISPECIES: Mu transposase C-terminal domain-containing protein [unclassified Variovorax]|uniref:Mu transposase C-terminal domain-containing protein n=1 Tax=unclassified Variovorax TaxID=663243 RepID=UPI0034E89288